MTVSELKSTTAIIATARITITKENAATLKGIYRGATSEDRLQDKDSIVICGMVSASLDDTKTYDFNSICNQIKSIVFDADDGTKYSPAMRARVARGVMMALVMLADPVYVIAKDTRTLKNGRKQEFETFQRPNWKSFEGKLNGEMTVQNENGKSEKVRAKGHPEGEVLVHVHGDTLQTVFRDLKDADGNLLYPPKNSGGKKAKTAPVPVTIARTVRVECAAHRTIMQDLFTGKRVIGSDANDIDLNDIIAFKENAEYFDTLDEKMTNSHGSDWIEIMRAAK